MKYQWVVIAAVSALALSPVAGSATDIHNQDDAAHTVTLTTADGNMVVEMEAKSEALNVCEGCEVSLADGQSVKAMADDVVTIAEGALVVGN